MPSSATPCHRRWRPFQELTPERGQPECLLELTGQDLFGVPLAAPYCPHQRIYVLPLLTILTNKVWPLPPPISPMNTQTVRQFCVPR